MSVDRTDDLAHQFFVYMKNIKTFFTRHNDLTKGSILKNILLLCAPLMAGMVLHGTQSLVDIFWVGRLGPDSIAAVAMSGTIIMFLFTLVSGISIGTISLVSKNIGAGNRRKADEILTQAMLIGMVVSVFCALFSLFSPFFLKSLGATAGVVSEGSLYLSILLVGSFTFVLLFLGNSGLQGSGDAFHPMLFLIIANVINIVFDPLLIFGLGPFPRMGTVGAAVATVLGQLVAMALVFQMLIKARSRVSFLPVLKLKKHIVFEILRIGLPASGQMFLRSVVTMALISLVAAFSTVAVAAYGVVMRIHFNMLLPAFALGTAAATLVGQNLGAGKVDRAKQSAWAATVFNLIIMLFLGFLFFAFSKQIMSLFSSSSEVVDLGSQFMKINAFFYVFIAFGVVLNRALGGAGDTFMPMVITFFSLVVYLFPMAYFLSRYTPMGLSGIWWAIGTSYAVNGLLILFWFETGNWKKVRPLLEPAKTF